MDLCTASVPQQKKHTTTLFSATARRLEQITREFQKRADTIHIASRICTLKKDPLPLPLLHDWIIAEGAA